MFDPAPNTFPVTTSRGCVYDCIFCTKNPGQDEKEKNGYRLVPLDSLKAHFTELKDKHYAKEIVILDGLVNQKESHFTGLVTMMNELGLKYDFPNGLRADRLKRKHIGMVKGRVGKLSISAESGSQAVVDGIVAKKQSLEAVERAARWCSELGVPLLIHYIIGLPGEGMSEINETLRHAWRMLKYHGAEPSVQFAVPLPGAKLHDLCVAERLLPDVPVDDFAPYFSRRPMIGTIAAPPSMLIKLKERFDLRKSVSRTQKVIINLTYECSNCCRFCAIGKRDKNTLSYDVVVDFLEKYRATGVRMADFDGGEPTLHPDLLEIVAAAKGLGYERLNVTTNGRRLASRDFTARLLLCGITDLLISIHGHNAQIHDFHTTKPGSFEETLAGLRNAVRLKPDRIDFGVNTTLTKVNAPHLMEFAEFVVREGAKKLNVQFITPFGSIEQDIVPDPAAAAAHLRRVIDKFADKLRIQVVNLPFCFMEGYEDFLVSDVYKNERNMVFVSAVDVNLADWLTAGRRRTDRCADCEYAIVCDGEYQFDVIGV
jgi:MoaA/NifB/PqqE/SkfB family radical SAM enzyme